MTFAGYSLLPVLPELVLAVGAMALLMLGAFRGPQTTQLVTGIAVVLLAVTGALIFWLWFGPLHGRPTILSKVNTALQILYLVGAILHAAHGLPPREVVEALAIVTFLSTLASGADYVTRFTLRAWSLPPRGA